MANLSIQNVQGNQDSMPEVIHEILLALHKHILAYPSLHIKKEIRWLEGVGEGETETRSINYRNQNVWAMWDKFVKQILNVPQEVITLMYIVDVEKPKKQETKIQLKNL